MYHKTEKFYVPQKIEEIFEIIKSETKKIIYAAGGISVNWRGNSVPVIISLENIIDNSIDISDESIRIGAGIKLSQLKNSELKNNKVLCSLISSAESVASPQIRNMATIGGNFISHFDFSDTLGSIYILEPDIEIIDKDSKIRILKFSECLAKERFRLQDKQILNAFIFSNETIRKYENSIYHKESKMGRDVGIINLSVFKYENKKEYDIAVSGYYTQIKIDRNISDIEKYCNDILAGPEPKTDLRSDSEYRKKIITYLIRKCVSDV